MNKKVEILKVDFSQYPKVKQRKIDQEIAKNDELRKDIEKKPYELVTSTVLTVTFKFKGKEYGRSTLIEAGWTYNYANIPWFVEPLSYDKHSPYMKVPSLAHDRVLDFRFQLWEEWELEKIFGSANYFRIFTSNLFEYLCIYSGVPEGKAERMAFCVDTFQKCTLEWIFFNRYYKKYLEDKEKNG